MPLLSENPDVGQDPRSIGIREIRQDQEFFQHDDENGVLYLRDGWSLNLQEDLSVETALFLKGILAKSANYTVTDSDGWIVNVTTGATDRTITLPTAADNTGRVMTFRKVDSGAGDVILDGEGSEQIAGETTLTLLDEGSVVTLQCNGTSWDWIGGHILGSNPSNGNYVVFSSGIQICWGNITDTPTLLVSNRWGTTSGNKWYKSVSVTFPATFGSTPVATANSNDNAIGSYATPVAIGTTSMNIVLDTYVSGRSIPANWIAIGMAG